MKRKLLLLVLTAIMPACIVPAQNAGVDSNHAGCDYTEPDDNSTANSTAWNALENKLYVSWASRNVQYKKREVPTVLHAGDMEIRAWRGERLGVEAVLYSRTTTGKLALKADIGNSGLVCEPRFMNWVLTDSKQGCGKNDNWQNMTNAFLVPDVIDIETTKAVEAKTTRPVWVTVEVPRGIEAASYDVPISVVNVADNTVVGTLNLKVTVCDKTLPEAKDYQFFLNFWQQPYAISRYYGLEKWSDAHCEALRPYLRMLARSGQKVITAIMHDDPWNDENKQSNDVFDPMIITTKNSNGTYSYNYDILDKWVELNMECGITGEIHFFSMVPWDNTFTYKNANGRKETLTAQPGTTAWTNYMTPYLESLAQHLREKGWLDKAYMALDERTSGVLNAYNLAHSKGFKTSLAGSKNSSYTDKLEDYCLELPSYKWTSSEIAARKAKGFRSTVYTCCSASDPNIILNNNQADGAYLPVHAIAMGCDGYLHWSWCNWTDSPLMDGRFRLFGGGDTYLVYPGNRSGVRFERVIEGVQLAEKVRILREEYTASGNTVALQTLNNMVEKFASGNVASSVTSQTSSAGLVDNLQEIVNGGTAGSEEPVDDYCITGLDSTGKEVAIEKRWLTSVTTEGAAQNLNYSSNSASANGYVLCGDEVHVRPGTSFTLRTQATTNDDDLRYCVLRVFADWDGDKIFESSVASLGVREEYSSGIGLADILDHTFTVNVPANAKTGLARIRFCYGDAWADSDPDACSDMLVKGFVFDVAVRVLDEYADAAYWLDEENTDIEMLRSQADNATRQLYLRRSLNANIWNSIVLPVSLDADGVHTAFGQSVKISELDNMDMSNGCCINFKKVDTDKEGTVIMPGKPYIIKPGDDMSKVETGELTFKRINKSETGNTSEETVTVDVTAASPVLLIPSVSFDAVTPYVEDEVVQEVTGNDAAGTVLKFRGVYIKKTENGIIPARSFVLGGKDGLWYHTVTPINTIKGFRAWIQSGSGVSEAKFSIDGVMEGDVTDINGIEYTHDTLSSDCIYDIRGQLVRSRHESSEGLAKGVYIKGGKKYVVK